MLTEDRVDAIFQEMDGYVLELASDPGALGPQYFQDIIATCRGYLNKVSLVISELNREKLAVSSELRKMEAAYDLEYDNLIANDDRVRCLANIEDRKSTAGFILRDQKRRINELKDRMHALDAVYKVVSYRNRELHATMTAIKDQRRLMQTEISTGAFYGDERVPKAQRPPREPGSGMGLDDITADDLAAMLQEPLEEESVDQTPSSTPEPAAPEAPPVAEASAEEEKTQPDNATDQDVIRFLESPDEKLPQAVVDETPSADSKQENELADVLSMLEGL